MANHYQPIQVTPPQLMDISPSSKVESLQGVSFPSLRLEPIVEQEKSNRSLEVCKNKTMTNKEFGEHLEELSNKVLLPYAMTFTAKDLNAANAYTPILVKIFSFVMLFCETLSYRPGLAPSTSSTA